MLIFYTSSAITSWVILQEPLAAFTMVMLAASSSVFAWQVTTASLEHPWEPSLVVPLAIGIEVKPSFTVAPSFTAALPVGPFT